MKRILLFLLLLTGCIQYPTTKVFQVNFSQNGEDKCLFLEVQEIEEDTYIVLSQESDSTNFVIQEIFDYDR